MQTIPDRVQRAITDLNINFWREACKLNPDIDAAYCVIFSGGTLTEEQNQLALQALKEIEPQLVAIIAETIKSVKREGWPAEIIEAAIQNKSDIIRRNVNIKTYNEHPFVPPAQATDTDVAHNSTKTEPDFCYN